MPDIRNAMQGAGFGRKGGPGGEQGNVNRGASHSRPGANSFPPGYPQYFTPRGTPRVELVTTEAETLAAKFKADDLKRHQLRAFYDHAKRQLQRLTYGVDFEDVRFEVVRLKEFAADRAARSENKLPLSFKEFIDRNIEAVTTQAAFQKGFMPHFEAVVAYCARIKD